MLVTSVVSVDNPLRKSKRVRKPPKSSFPHDWFGFRVSVPFFADVLGL